MLFYIHILLILLSFIYIFKKELTFTALGNSLTHQIFYLPWPWSIELMLLTCLSSVNIFFENLCTDEPETDHVSMLVPPITVAQFVQEVLMQLSIWPLQPYLWLFLSHYFQNVIKQMLVRQHPFSLFFNFTKSSNQLLHHDTVGCHKIDKITSTFFNRRNL